MSEVALVVAPSAHPSSRSHTRPASDVCNGRAAGSVTVPLSDIFGKRRVAAVEELALDGAQRLADVKRLRWDAGESLTRDDWGAELSGSSDERPELVSRQSRDQSSGREQGSPGLAQLRDGPLVCHRRHCKGAAVKLEPMEIRTFRVRLDPAGSGVV